MANVDDSKSLSWQWVATTVIGLLITMLFYLFQDIRSDLRDVRGTIDKNSWMVNWAQGQQNSTELKVAQLEALKGEVKFVGGRLDNMTRRILSIAQRQDKCKCPGGMEQFDLEVAPQKHVPTMSPDVLLHRATLLAVGCGCVNVDTVILEDMLLDIGGAFKSE